MIDLGQFDARRPVPASGAQQAGVFDRFRDRLKGLTETEFGSTIHIVVNNKERAMGTRSRVGVMHGNTVKSVYCHYDGYLSYTGEILLEHYDSARANDLVSRGDNSGVKETLDEMQFFSQRGHTDVDWAVAESFDQFLEQVRGGHCEYYYIMRDGVWYAGCVYDTEGLTKGGLTSLAQAISVLSTAQDQ